MRLVLIRHGKQDYTIPEGKGFFGPAREFAPLSQLGIQQAEAVALDPRLEGAQLIVSSPYTRALQTGAIISRVTGLKIEIAFDLHEWIIDTTYQNKNKQDILDAIEEIDQFKGVRHPDAKLHWEGYDQLAQRAYQALYPYLHYDKIIVTAHSYMMKQFYNPGHIDHCGIIEVDFDRNFKWPGYIEPEMRGKQ
ncbi:MAG: histidine phosphatase family protein [Anaerolineaceae bacterium]|jgi:broad specificity phosphatase PhoE